MKFKNFPEVFFISLLSLFSVSFFAQSPNYEWAMGAGSTGYDFGTAIAIDAQSNTYTTGFYAGVVDFDPGPGIHNLTSTGTFSTFILKTDASGNFIWAQSIGGNGVVEAQAITLSPSGNIYITGHFSGTVDFNYGAGVDTITNADNPCNTEIFILKLNTAGNYIWAKSIRGVAPICTVDTDQAYGIDFDQSENVYITGAFEGTADFNPSPIPADTFMLRTAGYSFETDLFILKLDPAGNFIWVKQAESAIGYALHVDPLGFVLVTGLYSYATDFNPGPGTDILPGFGNWDSFLMKLDTAGNYIWAKGIGGTGDDRGFGITCDVDGNVYATGHFTGTVDFNPSASTNNIVNPQYARAIYILKLSPSGNYLWAKGMIGTISGGGEREGTAIALDASKNIYVTGHFTENIDFNPSSLPADTFYLTATGAWTNTDAFITKTDSSGNFIWAVSMGAAGVDRGKSIVVDATNNVFTTGYFEGTVDFDPQSGIQNLNGNNVRDIFIQKLNQNPSAVSEQDISRLVISVYPNPTENFISLQAKNIIENTAIISVTDISGRILFQKDVAVTNGELNTQLEIGEFSCGIYFVQIRSANQNYSVKVVKK